MGRNPNEKQQQAQLQWISEKSCTKFQKRILNNLNTTTKLKKNQHKLIEQNPRTKINNWDDSLLKHAQAHTRNVTWGNREEGQRRWAVTGAGGAGRGSDAMLEGEGLLELPVEGRGGDEERGGDGEGDQAALQPRPRPRPRPGGRRRRRHLSFLQLRKMADLVTCFFHSTRSHPYIAIAKLVNKEGWFVIKKILY